MKQIESSTEIKTMPLKNTRKIILINNISWGKTNGTNDFHYV